MRIRKSRRRRGFTLMEVLLVLAILVILSSLAVIGYQKIQKGAYQNAAKVQIDVYVQAAGIFYSDVGRNPANLDELMVAPPDLPEGKWKGPYLDKLQVDPWSKAYDYQVIDDGNGNQKIRIHSSGPDGIDGTTDDVANINA